MRGELYPDELEEILRRHHVGHLACVAGGRPYVVPITYAYAGDAIYGHTLPGRKIDALRRQPRACLEVTAQEGPDVWSSVVVDGVYEELVDPAERAVALGLLARASPRVLPVQDHVPGVVFRLRTTAQTGRWLRAAGPPAADGADAGWPLEVALPQPGLGKDQQASNDRERLRAQR